MLKSAGSSSPLGAVLTTPAQLELGGHYAFDEAIYMDPLGIFVRTWCPQEGQQTCHKYLGKPCI